MSSLVPEYRHLNVPEEISYLRPRDPSIQHFNRFNLKRVLLQYSLHENTAESELFEVKSDRCIEETCIPVYLRMKPSENPEDYIIHQNELLYRTILKGKEPIHKKIVFSNIFSLQSKQVDVFNQAVKFRVFDFLNGKNTTFFTLGTSGSGKAYTTVGTGREPGFLPRSLEYIFKTLPEIPNVPQIKPTPEGDILKLEHEQKRFELALKTSLLKSQRSRDRLENIEMYSAMQESLKHEPFASLEDLSEVSIGVWVSFVAITNEEVFDLFQKNTLKNKLRLGIINGNPYLKDLTHICVSNGSEAFQAYRYGIHKLKDSKCISHSIFSIKLALTKKNQKTASLSSLNICNLAGSDSHFKIGSRENSIINNSLMVLGMCINKLENSLKNPSNKLIIPYRDSKLTQYFQRALSGLEDFCIILNINSSKSAIEETQNVLNFSAFSKNVIPKEIFISYSQSHNIANSVNHSDEEIRMLKDSLAEARQDYEDLKRNRAENLETDEKYLVAAWNDLLNDAKVVFNMKKEQLEADADKAYWVEYKKIESDIKRKIAKKNKKLQKKEADELKQLKLRVEKNEKTLQDLENEKVSLEKELKKLTDTALLIESNNSKIEEYARILENKEMDSFMLNEISCELKYFSNTADHSSSSKDSVTVGSNSNSSQIVPDVFSVNVSECIEMKMIIKDNNSSLLNEESFPELVSLEQTQMDSSKE